MKQMLGGFYLNRSLKKFKNYEPELMFGLQRNEQKKHNRKDKILAS